MQEGTLVRLLPRRAILVAGAAIMMATLPARAQEPVKAGMSGPFSGGLSLLGQSVRDGVEVAFAEINDQVPDLGSRRRIRQDEIDVLVRVSRPPPEYRQPPPGEGAGEARVVVGGIVDPGLADEKSLGQTAGMRLNGVSDRNPQLTAVPQHTLEITDVLRR